MSDSVKGNDFDTLEGAKAYIGTKLLKAVPMDRQTYNDFRGWVLPADEDGSDAGYIVQHDYDDYVSWLTADQFEDTYREQGRLTFGLAIEALKMGMKVRRKNVRLKMRDDQGEAIICMDSEWGDPCPYLASSSDMLAEDWSTV